MSTTERAADMTPEELIAAIQAGLDADEQAAREAGNRRWLVEDNTISLWPEDECDGFMTWPTRADARHAARWEPQRVLAEVEAKREILAEHYPVDPCDAHDAAFRTVACGTLIALARPFLDREDVRPEA